MATYTTNGGIKKIATGDESGTWGTSTNTNFDIIDRLSVGVGDITLSGTTHTLTTSEGASSDGQYHLVVLGGSPSGTNTITVSPNDVKRLYVVKNNSGQTATFTQGSGANVSVSNGKSAVIYCDGAGSGAAVVDVTSTFNSNTTLADLGVTATASELNIMDGVTATTADLNIMDGVTASTAELNIMDGVTATTAELNIMDGVTATTAELNIMDGVTATTAELNIMDGVTATATELNYNDITTLGLVQASKTVTADSNADIKFSDGDKILIGDDADLEIYHTGSHSYIAENGTGNLTVLAGNWYLNNSADTQNMMTAINGGAVKLFHNGAEKFETSSDGINVTGTATTDGVTVAGTLDIEEVYEKVLTQTSTTGTITFDTTAQGVEFFTVSQAANRTINFSNVNANLATGQSVTVAILLTQGGTAYYLNAYQVDGSTVTPKWSGGSAPTGGNASGIDSYSFTIIKTADATFTVLASQTQFA